MGELRWTNNSSYVVEWFAISVLGTATGSLNPGESQRLDNEPNIRQIGIQSAGAPVYVIDDLYPEDGIDAHVLASDIIPL